MTLAGFIAVGLGAWLRWWLSVVLNPLFPTLPYGTLTANLTGGYLVGVAVAYFGHHTGLPPEARLFAVTGFLGGLTTFSTFSAEIVSLVARAQYAWALAAASAHLFGSLFATSLGIVTVNLFEQAKEAGIRGGSVMRAIAGYGRHGVLHEDRFFELAGDLPVVVEFVVSDAEATTLIELVGAERASLFYVKAPVEFGVTRDGG